MKVLFLLLLTSAVSVHGKEYPTTYPLDQTDLPADLPRGNPNFLFDDTDSGGYVALILDCDFGAFPDEIAAETFTTPSACGWYARRWFELDLPPYFAPRNCTPNAIITQEVFNEQFTLQANLPECPGYMTAKFNFYGAGAYTRYSDLTQIVTCPDYTTELLCGWMFHGASFCATNFLDPGSREFVLPCYDVFAYWLRGCALFSPMSNYISLDMDTYHAELTLDESITFEVLRWSHDRVCHPYAYYHPDNDDSSPTTGTNSPGETPEDNDSSAKLIYSTLLYAM